MHNMDSRFVVRTSNILSAGLYVCDFQPEILQAGAVKGLSTTFTYLLTKYLCLLVWNQCLDTTT